MLPRSGAGIYRLSIKKQSRVCKLPMSRKIRAKYGVATNFQLKPAVGNKKLPVGVALSSSSLMPYSRTLVASTVSLICKRHLRPCGVAALRSFTTPVPAPERTDHPAVIRLSLIHAASSALVPSGLAIVATVGVAPKYENCIVCSFRLSRGLPLNHAHHGYILAGCGRAGLGNVDSQQVAFCNCGTAERARRVGRGRACGHL